jgi:hypothetical protein
MRNRRTTDVKPSNTAYHCTTRWRVKASIEEVADVLADPLDLPRWWPSVYLAADELSRARDGSLERVRLRTRGWLPYTLRWDLTVVRSEYPRGFVIAASGDLEGEGVWTLTERDGEVDATFDWRVTARKPLLRHLSPLFKPLFVANHHWAMRQGERSLCRELARRRAEGWSLDASRVNRESSAHG